MNPGKPGERVIPSRFSDHVLHPGEVFSLDTPGGGGLGNPLERDPERVLNDVRNGYVTQKRAREVYRVAIDSVDSDFVDQSSSDGAIARAKARGATRQ